MVDGEPRACHRRPGSSPHARPTVTPTDQPGATDDLLDRIEATRCTLASCLPLVDEELAATVTAAMACLDDVARLASALPVDQRGPWLAELTEIEEMAGEIHAHLHSDDSR
jgi:hypothetical protein